MDNKFIGTIPNPKARKPNPLIRGNSTRRKLMKLNGG
jgi:hypothetical protein